MTDYDEAVRRALTVRESLLDHGVRAVSIELQQGRPGTPHGEWYDTRFEAVLSHHIASYRSQGLTPGLALVKRGRPDLPGPLCNGYGGFDLTYRIICAGWANHPGLGGPWDVGPVTIPKDNGRAYLWGTEYEGGYREADWPDEFHEFMSRSNAGLVDVPWIGAGDADRHGEHKTWAPVRKTDRMGYTTQLGRDRLRPYLGGAHPVSPPPEPEPAPPVIEIPEADMAGKKFQVVGDPAAGAQYSVSAATLQHIPDVYWLDVQTRMGLVEEGDADTFNMVQFEWGMKTVLEAGGQLGCPTHCGTCLLETRYLSWADASDDRAAIAALTTEIRELDDEPPVDPPA